MIDGTVAPLLSQFENTANPTTIRIVPIRRQRRFSFGFNYALFAMEVRSASTRRTVLLILSSCTSCRVIEGNVVILTTMLRDSKMNRLDRSSGLTLVVALCLTTQFETIRYPLILHSWTRLLIHNGRTDFGSHDK